MYAYRVLIKVVEGISDELYQQKTVIKYRFVLFREKIAKIMPIDMHKETAETEQES